MASNKILLQAKAKRLGIAPEKYRKLSESELQEIIATAEKGTSAKGSGAAVKGSGNGSNGTTAKKGTATKGSGAAKTSAQKGSASKAAPATSSKSSTKGAGKTGTAKRQSAAAGTKKGSGTTAKKGTAKASTAKRSTAKKGTAKRSAAAPKNQRVLRNTKSKVIEGRSPLNRDKIKWDVESAVGATPGKRMDVMKKLRQFQGDSAKVFKSLRSKAREYYPSKNEHAAERQLVWLINRVAYDYAYKTGQHERGTRAAYGTSTAAQDIRRREQREAERKEQEKAERAKKRKANERKAGGKSAPKRSTAKKGTAKRSTAKKGSK